MAKEVITDDLREAIERAWDAAYDRDEHSAPTVDVFIAELRNVLYIKDRLGQNWRGARHV